MASARQEAVRAVQQMVGRGPRRQRNVRRPAMVVRPRFRRRNGTMARNLRNLRQNIGQTASVRASAGQMTARNDEMIHQKCEQIGEVVPGLNLFKFTPGKSGCLVLDKLGSIYDNYRITSAVAKFKSAVATVNNGSLAMGIDYNPATQVSTAAQVEALTGSQKDNVYKDITVEVSAHKAQKQKWFSTASADADPYQKTAFTVAVYAPEVADVTSVGSIWLSYSVVFSSINVSSGSIDADSAAATSTFKALPGVPAPALNTDPVVDDTPGSSGTVAFKKQPVVNSDQPTDVASVSEPIPKNDFHETGDSLTAASVVQNLPPAADGMAAPSGKVNFLYSDGTPVEAGAIKSFPIQGTNSFRAGHGVVPHDRATEYAFVESLGTNILADVFTIVKPLIKELPLVGEIVSTLFDSAFDGNDEPAVEVGMVDDHISIMVLNADAYPIVTPVTNAISIGTSLTAQLPESNEFNSVDIVPFQYTAVMGITTAGDVHSRFESMSGPYTAEITYDTSHSTDVPTYIKLTPVAGADPIRAGDMFAYQNFRIQANPTGGTGNIFYNTADSTLTNMEMADGQGPASIDSGRTVCVKRDAEAITFKLPDIVMAVDTVVTFQFVLARSSRCDSITQADIPTVSSNQISLRLRR
jgi:hypothetical protein